MIRLFFGVNEVELDESVSIALTKEFEDIENLTNIKNSWSKTVSIPASAKNNRIFNILTLDSDITHLNTLLYGRYDFYLKNDSDVIMTGYAQLNNLKMEGQFGYYEFNLYGELGNVLLEAQKFTFNESEYEGDNTSKKEYYIDSSLYFKKRINSVLVWNSWNKQRTDDDVIGWAPNNSFNSNFDYKTYEQLEDGEAKTFLFKDTLEGVEIEKYTSVPAETIVGDGILPRQIGEYRSYHQIPYIYFPKLLQIFINQLAVNTKTKPYTVVLDEKWFNENNPHYYDQVMLLKGLKLKDNNNNNNDDNTYSKPYFLNIDGTKKQRIMSWIDTEQVDWTASIPRFLQFEYINEQKPIYENGVFTRDTTITERFSFSFNFNIGNNAGLTELSDNNNLDIYIWLTDADTGEKVKQFHYIMSTLIPATQQKDYIIKKISTSFNLSNTFLFKIGELPDTSKLKLFVSASWSAQRRPFKPITQNNGTVWVDITDNSTVDFNLDNTILSNKTITLADLWDYNYSIYDKIIEYCKIFRIFIEVDSFKKTIRFIQARNYFAESSFFSGQTEDWSNKVDYSREWTINPFSWDYKYLKFNYDQTNTKIGNEYKSATGYNYGELRLKTDYNFTNETNELFDGVKNTIEVTEQTLNWDTLYKQQVIIYTVPNEIMIYSRNDSNEFVNCFGEWAFYDGLKTFDTSLRQVKITDDTDLQLSTNNYFYGQDVAPGLITLRYASLRIKKGDYFDLFEAPLINYTNDNYDDAEGIWLRVWSGYCEERYGVNNKILTCYVRLKPQDFQNYSPKNFVKIGNQLYMVNRIIDYDPSSEEPTKCELITMQKPENYIK